MRWWYTIKQGWAQRHALKQFLLPTKQIHSLEEITPQKLDEANIAILVLDFDGVLAPHGAVQLLPQAKEWLRELAQRIGENRIAILTNKPLASRLRILQQQFPSIFVVHGVRKKPYPDGLLQVAEYKGVDPHRLVLIDDRLLTGMLATCLAYAQGWYFRHPYHDYWRHPLTEVFFSFLRVFERWMIRLIG